MTIEQPRVLVMLDYFLPGQKAGGPVRTVAALVRRVREFDFVIATRDRDLGDDAPFTEALRNAWIVTAGRPCRYLSPRQLGPRSIGRLLRSVPHDILYVNSLYSRPFTLWPLALRRLRLVPRPPVVVAPRGQLHSGALALKARKKQVFLAAARRLGLFADVRWQATDAEEAELIRKTFGADASVMVAPNLRLPSPPPVRAPAAAGPLRVVFVSRIARNKNLLGAIEILAGVRAELQFDIYGPVEDAAHWRACTESIALLPANIAASYHGALGHHDVRAVFSEADVLLLPTHGESFGHVIIEALSAGCLALVSDRTPWRGLAAAGVGWDLPLDAPEAFRAVLEALAHEDPAQRDARAARAVAWARAHDDDPAHERQVVALLQAAAASAVPAPRCVRTRPRGRSH